MQLSRDDPVRKHHSINGRSRFLKNNTTNEVVANQIVARAFDLVRVEAIELK
jgi:hypothetical protein